MPLTRASNRSGTVGQLVNSRFPWLTRGPSRCECELLRLSDVNPSTRISNISDLFKLVREAIMWLSWTARSCRAAVSCHFPPLKHQTAVCLLHWMKTEFYTTVFSIIYMYLQILSHYNQPGLKQLFAFYIHKQQNNRHILTQSYLHIHTYLASL